jgi:hypothetical protein
MVKAVRVYAVTESRSAGTSSFSTAHRPAGVGFGVPQEGRHEFAHGVTLAGASLTDRNAASGDGADDSRPTAAPVRPSIGGVIDAQIQRLPTALPVGKADADLARGLWWRKADVGFFGRGIERPELWRSTTPLPDVIGRTREHPGVS